MFEGLRFVVQKIGPEGGGRRGGGGDVGSSGSTFGFHKHTGGLNNLVVAKGPKEEYR